MQLSLVMYYLTFSCMKYSGFTLHFKDESHHSYTCTTASVLPQHWHTHTKFVRYHRKQRRVRTGIASNVNEMHINLDSPQFNWIPIDLHELHCTFHWHDYFFVPTKSVEVSLSSLHMRSKTSNHIMKWASHAIRCPPVHVLVPCYSD